MRIPVTCLLFATSIFGCKKSAPVGTVVTDWTYTPTTPADSAPTALNPSKTVTQEVVWPLAHDAPVQLRFETEIGEQIAGGMRWHTPRHVRVSLAQPTSVTLPKVDCMAAPPGNTVGPQGRLVPPVGGDGTTPLGKVACFFLAPEPDNYVFDVDGDGKVTSSLPAKGGSH
jgi:hypothetical protein